MGGIFNTYIQWDDIHSVLDHHIKLDFISILAHWNNTLRIDMSLNSNTLSWFRAKQSLLFLLNAVCLAEKYNVANSNFIVFVWPDRGSNPRSTALLASMLTITPPMQLKSTTKQMSNIQCVQQIPVFSILLCKSLLCPAIRCVRQNIVSTLVFNVHLFNFPLLTCCGHAMLLSDLLVSSIWLY